MVGQGFGWGLAVTVAARAVLSEVPLAPVVVVDGSAGGGDSGAASGMAVGPGRAMSAPGREAASPPDSMATDTALPDRGSACDTATAVTTMATLHSATTNTRGDRRRTQRRCTDLTSSPPVREARAHSRARPQPVRLVYLSLAPGWWRLPREINRLAQKISRSRRGGVVPPCPSATGCVDPALTAVNASDAQQVAPRPIGTCAKRGGVKAEGSGPGSVRAQPWPEAARGDRVAAEPSGG